MLLTPFISGFLGPFSGAKFFSTRYFSFSSLNKPIFGGTFVVRWLNAPLSVWEIILSPFSGTSSFSGANISASVEMTIPTFYTFQEWWYCSWSHGPVRKMQRREPFPTQALPADGKLAVCIPFIFQVISSMRSATLTPSKGCGKIR